MRDVEERVGVVTNKMRVALGVFATVGALATFMASPSAQDTTAEEFTAFAINMNRRPTSGPAANRPSSAQLRFRIERWSTAEERDSLTAILKEVQDVNRMNDTLLRALQRLPRVGWIRETTSLSWDLHYAQQTPLPDGGRRILIATDRRIGFWEATNRPRSIDYPFTILEMRLDKDNRGEGKLLADTRLLFDTNSNTLTLENYDISPVRLNRIQRAR
jgi:hypothetical protein